MPELAKCCARGGIMVCQWWQDVGPGLVNRCARGGKMMCQGWQDLVLGVA